MLIAASSLAHTVLWCKLSLSNLTYHPDKLAGHTHQNDCSVWTTKMVVINKSLALSAEKRTVWHSDSRITASTWQQHVSTRTKRQQQLGEIVGVQCAGLCRQLTWQVGVTDVYHILVHRQLAWLYRLYVPTGFGSKINYDRPWLHRFYHLLERKTAHKINVLYDIISVQHHIKHASWMGTHAQDGSVKR